MAKSFEIPEQLEFKWGFPLKKRILEVIDAIVNSAKMKKLLINMVVMSLLQFAECTVNCQTVC